MHSFQTTSCAARKVSATRSLTPLTLARLVELTEGTPADVTENDQHWLLSGPDSAGADQFTVVWTRDSLETALAAGAGLLVLPADLSEHAAGHARIVVRDARLALAQLSAAAKPQSTARTGIHESAVVHESARIDPGASIGPNCTVAADVTIGAGSIIGAGSTIGERSVIGTDCRIDAGVHVYHDVILGKRVILQSGAVLGADGFGFAMSPAGAVRIEHLGRVELGDDVEVGANSSIDRATLGVTSVGARTKIDNLVQVGHNVRIGSDCIIIGQSAIGGSTVIGNRVTLAGNAAIADHVVIEDDATIGALSGVSKRVPKGEFWFGIPAVPQRQWIRRQYLSNRLEEIWAFVRKERKK